MKDKSDISLSFRFLKECSLSENVLILYFLKKESNINRTFNLPNFNAKTVWQRTDHKVGIPTVGQLPNIMGGVNIDHANLINAFGCCTADSNVNQYYGAQPESHLQRLLIDASKSSSIYQNVNIVVPANNSVVFCIRY